MDSFHSFTTCSINTVTSGRSLEDSAVFQSAYAIIYTSYLLLLISIHVVEQSYGGEYYMETAINATMYNFLIKTTIVDISSELPHEPLLKEIENMHVAAIIT